MSDELFGYVDQTNAEYHAAPGINKSRLDAIDVSPLNYWDIFVNPDAEPQEYKHCFAIGDGTHKLVLEPGTFEHTYAVGFDKSAFPGALDTTDDMKKVLAESMLPTSGTKPELARRLVEEAGIPRERILMYLKEDHDNSIKGKIEIPARDYKGMIGMLQAVNNHRWAGPLLKGARTEESFFVDSDETVNIIDHATGKVVEVIRRRIKRKCRTDAISADGSTIIDLKTTDDVSLAGFGTTIARRRYEVQAAWYLDILQMLYGRDAPRNFAFVAAQKTRPYDVAVHCLDRQAIERGRRLYQKNLALLIRSEHYNDWPGADGGDLLTAQLPRWAQYDE